MAKLFYEDGTRKRLDDKMKLIKKRVSNLVLITCILTPPGPGPPVPASYTVGTESFTVIKQPKHSVKYPSSPKAEVKERVELYLYSRSGPSWSVVG